MSALGQPFIILDKVDSTNNYAMGQVHAQMSKHGTVYFAREQTAGKGQRSKSWSSLRGQNIMLSLVIEPFELIPHQTFFLSAAIGLSCREFFAKLAGNETSIKWPNDLYWCDRKAGGILIENLFKGKLWTHAIVGVGININQIRFPSSLSNPVSLKQITGIDYDPLNLARDLCKTIETWFNKLRAGETETILEAYQNALYRRGERVRLKMATRVFEALILGVDKTGKLRVKAGEMEEELDFGEIEWLNLSS